jgi:hypothetical protein
MVNVDISNGHIFPPPQKKWGMGNPPKSILSLSTIFVEMIIVST